jgi:hypothetical protein
MNVMEREGEAGLSKAEASTSRRKEIKTHELTASQSQGR